MNETRVGIRELKARLSEHLRRVKAGETIIVTDHGAPIGRIIPILPTVEDHLHAMVSAGLLEWNGRKLPHYRPQAVNRGDRLLSDLVVEDRE
ncbi:MAG TPA: type II toxin-antitoxin system prevent-host-death family antitoxin [Anaerolineales bacterium]|nr:type II toxin-antitoxin system prevent-host-death family antitoxin [Anaerolineales bacterium]